METEKIVLLVLTNYNYNQDEYKYLREALEGRGIGVKIGAEESGMCTSVTGEEIDVDVSLENAFEDEYDGVAFIGGPGVDVYFNSSSVIDLAQRFFKAGKFIAAICWAPVILARSGILNGRRATIWEGAIADFQKAGAIYTGEAITVDGTIFTANSSNSAGELGEILSDAVLNK